jgi:HK97 family phage major capsid protein
MCCGKVRAPIAGVASRSDERPASQGDADSVPTLGQSNARRTCGRWESGELRALSKVTSGAGPELVPQTFVNMLEIAILAYGDMLSFVDTITTAAGEVMNWPIMNDTANSGVLVGTEGEDTQVIGEPDPVFSRLTWTAYEMHSRWIKTPIALEEDSMFDLEMLLAGALGERLGRLLNTLATTGTGSSQPFGIVTDSVAGVTAASATAISYDDLVRLEHSVDPNLRASSRYMFNDSILQALRLLKDTTGMPLWTTSMRDGAPDRLNGKPYVYNQAMASSIATTQITALFGDLTKYKLRRVRGIRIIRATERFAEKLQVGYLGYMRADGRLLKPAAAARCPVKRLTQA